MCADGPFTASQVRAHHDHRRGGKFDNEVISKLKELTKGNEPYVRKAAVVGMSRLYKVVLMAMLSNREFHIFDTTEEAKDFLVQF